MLKNVKADLSWLLINVGQTQIWLTLLGANGQQEWLWQVQFFKLRTLLVRQYNVTYLSTLSLYSLCLYQFNVRAMY